MDSKFKIGQEVWHVVNGLIVNGYVEQIVLNKEGLLVGIHPAIGGFNLRREEFIFSSRDEAKAFAEAPVAAVNSTIQ